MNWIKNFFKDFNWKKALFLGLIILLLFLFVFFIIKLFFGKKTTKPYESTEYTESTPTQIPLFFPRNPTLTHTQIKNNCNYYDSSNNSCEYHDGSGNVITGIKRGIVISSSFLSSLK